MLNKQLTLATNGSNSSWLEMVHVFRKCNTQSRTGNITVNGTACFNGKVLYKLVLVNLF